MCWLTSSVKKLTCFRSVRRNKKMKIISKKLVFVFLFYASFVNSHKNDEIAPSDTVCDYIVDEVKGYVARCSNIILKDESEHVRFTGVQADKKTNEDVKYLEIVQPSNIKFIPSQDIFTYFMNLENLDVRNVNVEVLDYIYNCYPLVYITLSHNHIREILYDAFFVCRDLKKLDLSHNIISNIHENAFGPTKNLVELDVSYNQLSTLSRKLLKPIKSLRKLNLKNNKLKTIPFNVFNDLFDLQVLDVSNNPLSMLDSRLFDFLMFLEDLNLSTTYIKKFAPGTFKSLKRLKYLDISGNSLHTLDGEMLSKNSEMEELRINRMQLFDVGRHFFDKINKLALIEAAENKCIDGIFKGTVDEIREKFETCISNSDNKRRDPQNVEL